MVQIVSWNVNSIRVRLPQLLFFLAKESPEIVLLQELKAQEEAIPCEDIQALGYNTAFLGQKTYNGVGILSKLPISDVQIKLPGDEEDQESRYIEALCGPYHVASVYVPNGSEIGSEKYKYKLRFLERLYRHLSTVLKSGGKIVIGGDYNIAPFDIDCYDPTLGETEILCSDQERSALRALLHLGYYDSFRTKYPDVQAFSWWDYRNGSWPKNQGLRIDHLLLSPEAVDDLEDAGIYKEVRSQEKASDHAPVWCKLST